MILPFFLDLLFVNQTDTTKIEGTLGVDYFAHQNSAGKIDGYVSEFNNFILDQFAKSYRKAKGVQ